MSTPGRRKALKALAAVKRKNNNRIARGLKPVVAGKKMSLKSFKRKGGAGSKTEAKARVRARKGK